MQKSLLFLPPKGDNALLGAGPPYPVLPLPRGGILAGQALPSFRKEAKGYVHFSGAEKLNQRDIHLLQGLPLYGEDAIDYGLPTLHQGFGMAL